MTISIIMKDWYSHRSMRTPFGKGMESTLDFEATRIPQLKLPPPDLGFLAQISMQPGSRRRDSPESGRRRGEGAPATRRGRAHRSRGRSAGRRRRRGARRRGDRGEARRPGGCSEATGPSRSLDGDGGWRRQAAAPARRGRVGAARQGAGGGAVRMGSGGPIRARPGRRWWEEARDMWREAIGADGGGGFVRPGPDMSGVARGKIRVRGRRRPGISEGITNL